MPNREATEGWERDLVHFPTPLHPLSASYCLEPVGPGCERGFAAWSLPLERYRYKAINGWVYSRIDPFGGEPPALFQRAIKRFPLLGHAWRLNPKVRRRMLSFERFVTDGGFERNVDRWEQEWRPEAERRIGPLRSFPVETASDQALAGHLDAIYGFFSWAWTIHVNLHVLCMYVRGRFLEIARRLFGLTNFEAFELIHRSDPITLEGTKRLSAIARGVAGDREVSAALAKPAEQALVDVEGTWFHDSLNGFLDFEGDRPIEGFEIVHPTWREMPELIVALIKDMIASPYDPDAEEARFEAHRAARIADLRGRLSHDERAEFDRWLDLGTRAYPLNESHNYLLAEFPLGLARYAALEAGRRLTKAGSIEDPEDVFYLYRTELTSIVRDKGDAKELVRLRRKEHEQNLRLTPPAVIGSPSGPPPLDTLPPAVAMATKIILEQVEEMFGVPPQEASEHEIRGIAGGPGVGEGPARVVLLAEDFHKVRPGDVLICPLTTPAWTVLFSQIAGLVTDSGGALSHAAIVAREYGIPSVVGTLDATRRLIDDKRVRVNGDSGVVEILGSAIADAS